MACPSGCCTVLLYYFIVSHCPDSEPQLTGEREADIAVHPELLVRLVLQVDLCLHVLVLGIPEGHLTGQRVRRVGVDASD